MKLSSETTYAVLNYGSHPISVTVGHNEYIIPECADGVAGVIYLTLNEITELNSRSSLIRSGELRFDKEDEANMYETLRITNYKDILTNEEIEEIFLNPTVENLTTLLDVKDPTYFYRIYGVFTGLVNANKPIAANIEKMMRTRFQEIKLGVKNTKIKLSDTSIPQSNDSRIKELEQQIAALTKMLEAKNDKEGVKEVEEKKAVTAAPKPKKPTAKKKPAPKKA